MTLQSSGAISLLDVRNELGLSGTISLNDSAVRTLLGRASGQISLSDAYGKSNFIPVTGIVWSGVSPIQATLSWNAIANNPTYTYEIQSVGVSSSGVSDTTEIITGSTTATSITVSLLDDYTYTGKVKSTLGNSYVNYANVSTSDVGQTMATAPLLSLVNNSCTRKGYFTSNGDIDVYKIYLNAGSVSFQLSASYPGTAVNFNIYSSAGGSPIFSSGYATQSIQAAVNLPASDFYYIAVMNSLTFSKYTLNIWR